MFFDILLEDRITGLLDSLGIVSANQLPNGFRKQLEMLIVEDAIKKLQRLDKWKKAEKSEDSFQPQEYERVDLTANGDRVMILGVDICWTTAIARDRFVTLEVKRDHKICKKLKRLAVDMDDINQEICLTVNSESNGFLYQVLRLNQYFDPIRVELFQTRLMPTNKD